MSELRIGLAGLLIIALAVLTGIPMFIAIPETSQRVIDTSVGGLIAGLTITLQGLFRNDKTDELRAENTASAFNAIANASTPSQVEVINPPSSPVPVEPAEPDYASFPNEGKQ